MDLLGFPLPVRPYFFSEATPSGDVLVVHPMHFVVQQPLGFSFVVPVALLVPFREILLALLVNCIGSQRSTHVDFGIDGRRCSALLLDYLRPIKI